MTRGNYYPMFEINDFDNILRRNLDNVSAEIDKREGSVIYDAIAPFSIEVALLYAYLDFLFKNGFADTANRYWLIERAKERGIEPYSATPSTIIGKFNVEIDIGKRFRINDIYFNVTKFINHDEFYYYELVSESVGTIGNIASGKLTPTETIRDLTTSEISSIAILGEDEEETETFRERYFETIRVNAYGGNIDDYKIKVKAIEGVGTVKIIPVWNGGGTVKVIITDSDFQTPSPELISKVQEILDPVPFQQKGVGIAPIGHLVTVVGTRDKAININAKIMIGPDGDSELIKSQIREAIESYFESVRKNWGNYDKQDGHIYVQNDIRLTKIMSLILTINNVIEYEEIDLGAPEDKIITLEPDEIPVLGELVVTI